MNKKIFIASSSSAESKNIAMGLKENLEEEDYIVTFWPHNFLTPSQYILDNITNELKKIYDFAIFLFTPEDKLQKNGDTYLAVRDNVLIELGLAIGILSREHCFILAPRNFKDLNLSIPSDLLGINLVLYNHPIKENPVSELAIPSSKILKTLQKLGETKNLSIEYLVERGKLTDLYINLTKKRDEIDIIALSLYCFVDNYKPEELITWLRKKHKTIRILVLDPNSCAVKLRSIEEKINLRQKIIDVLKSFKRNFIDTIPNADQEFKGSFEIRLYNGIPYMGYFRADQEIIYGFNYPFLKGQMSDSLYLKEEDSNIQLYHNLRSTFDKLWESSVNNSICTISSIKVEMNTSVILTNEPIDINCKSRVD